MSDLISDLLDTLIEHVMNGANYNNSNNNNNNNNNNDNVNVTVFESVFKYDV